MYRRAPEPHEPDPSRIASTPWYYVVQAYEYTVTTELPHCTTYVVPLVPFSVAGASPCAPVTIQKRQLSPVTQMSETVVRFYDTERVPVAVQVIRVQPRRVLLAGAGVLTV